MTSAPQDGPFGPCSYLAQSRSFGAMNDRGFHYIDEDLGESWIEDWAAVGVRELEALLANHAAFRGYLDTVEE